MQTFLVPRRATEWQPGRHVLALLIIALIASLVVVAPPGLATADALQTSSPPIDCKNPDPDVTVIKTGTVVPTLSLFATERVAFEPGIYTVSEGAVSFKNIEVTSCDVDDRALLLNSSFSFRGDLASSTVHIHDIDFDSQAAGIVRARGDMKLIVERASLAMASPKGAANTGSAITLFGGASGELLDLEISGAGRGISATNAGHMVVERVTVKDAVQFGVYIAQEGNGTPLRALADLDQVTVLDTSLEAGAGIYLAGGDFTVSNSLSACNRNHNLRAQSSVENTVVALTNVTLGQRLDGGQCATAQNVGLLTGFESTLTMTGGTIAGNDTGVLIGEGTGGPKTFTNVKIAANLVGIDSVQKAELTQVTFSENSRDCQVTEGLIIADSFSANDGSCVASPGPTGVDCAVPPVGTAVLQPTDDLAAAIKAGGLVLLQPGRYQVSVEQTISQDLELTSCDPSNPATLVRTSPCQRVLLVQGAAGLTATIHDLAIEGGSAGITARGGLHLDLDRVDLKGVLPYCDDNDRALEISGGSTGDVTDVNVTTAQYGARIDTSGDVSFTNVVIDDSDDYGLYLIGANVSSASRATISLDNVSIINTNRAGSTGHGLLAISTNVNIVNSNLACNHNSNIRATTFDAATDTTKLTIDQTTVGLYGDNSTCPKDTQTDGIRTSGMVQLAMDDVNVFAHPGVGVALEKGQDQSTIRNSAFFDNNVGLQTERPVFVQNSLFDNGQDCQDDAGNLITDGGDNGDSDESCFVPPIEFTLAPATTNDGMSITTVAGQEVLRIERPIGFEGSPDTAIYSEFVITASEPAPVGGLDVEWTLGASTLAGLPSADRADIVFQEQIAAKRQGLALGAQVDALPGGFVSSSRIVTIPEGKTSVIVRVVPQVDLDPAEAIVISIADSDVQLDAVISPTQYQANVVVPAEPLVIDAGESAQVQVQLTPALPKFARRDQVRLAWTISGINAAGLVTETTGVVEFDADELDAASSIKAVPIVATNAATTTHDLRFALVEGDGIDFTVRLPELVVESVVPRTGDEFTLTSGDESLTVLELNPGNDDQGFFVELNRVAKQDTTVEFTVAGIDVGLAKAADETGDFATTARSAKVPAGESRVFVPFEAASDQKFEPVEGFEIIAFVQGAIPEGSTAEMVEAKSARLFGFISPDSFRVDFDASTPNVNEADEIEIRATLSPADPYSDGLFVPWTMLDSAGFDADVQDLVTVPSDIEFVFDETRDDGASMTRTFLVEFREHDGPEATESYGLGLDVAAAATVFTGRNEVRGIIVDTSDSAVRVLSVRPSDGHAISLPTDAGPRQVLAIDGRRDEPQGIIVELDRPVERDLELLITVDEKTVELAVPIDVQNDLVFAPGVVTAGDVVFGGIAPMQVGQTELFIPFLAPVTPEHEPVEAFELHVRVNGTTEDRTVSLEGIIQPDSFEVRATNIGVRAVAEGQEFDVVVGILPGNPYGDPVDVPWKVITEGVPTPSASPDDFVVASGVISLPPGDDADVQADLVVITPIVDDVGEPTEFFEVGLDTDTAGPHLQQLRDNADGSILGTAPTSYSIEIAPEDQIVVNGVTMLELLPTEPASFFIVVDEPVTVDTQIVVTVQGIEIEEVGPATPADLLTDLDVLGIQTIATIPADSDRVEVIISAPEDPTGQEKAEAFELAIEPPTAEPLSLKGIIQPDNVELEIVPVDAQGSIARGSEASGFAFDVVMTPAYAFTSELNVSWTINGDGTFGVEQADAADFAASSGVISFASTAADTVDSATRRVEIAVVNDQQAEPEEGFALAIPQEDDVAIVLLGYLTESPAGSAGETPDPNDDAVPFGGFKLEDPEGTVRQDENGTQGDVRGKFKLPEWPDDIPVTIQIRDGQATVTYDDTFDDVELGEPPFLRIVNPRVIATAQAGLDGSMRAEIVITADRAEFFPETDGGAIATATNLRGVANTDGSIRFTTDAITGTFADLTVAFNDVALVVSDKPNVALLSVANVETVDGVAITGLKVFRDGRIVIAEVCVNDENDLVGRIGIAGLGFTLEEACLRTADNGDQSFDVTGVFDAELTVPGAGDIVSGVSVGLDPEATGRASFSLAKEASGSFTPEQLGPLVVDLGPFAVAGLTAQGTITAPGWQNGLLDPTVDGEFTITGDNLLLDDADITASVDGSVTVAGPATTLAVDATVAGSVSLADGLVVIDEGELGLAVSITSTTTETAGTASTELTVAGPTLTAADLTATVTIPGLDDVDGDPVQVDATVDYDEDSDSWTIEVEPTLASGWDFGAWTLNEVSGMLVLAPNAPVGQRIDGEFILLANVTSETNDVTSSFTLEVNDTPTAGEYALSIDSETTWSGTGIPGLTVDNGKLTIEGDAVVNLADPSFDVTDFTATGSFDEAKLALGEFVVDLQGTTVQFDGDDTTPLLQADSVTAGIEDSENPGTNLITLIIEDLTIADDGAVAVGLVRVGDIDNLTDTIGLNGILPFTLSSVEARFGEPGNFDTFALRAVGAVNLDNLGGLDVRVAQGVGTSADCTVEGPSTVPFDFTVNIESLSTGQIVPQDLQDLSIAVCNVDLGGVIGSASISLGGYRNGQLVPEVAATASIESGPDVAGSLTGGAAIAIAGVVQATPTGAVLVLEGDVTLSGAFDDNIVVEDAAFDFGFDVVYTDTTGAIEIENAQASNGTVKRVRLAIDDVIAFEAEVDEDADEEDRIAIFPEPGVLISFVDATVSVEFGEELGVLDGWGGSAGNFTVVTTDDGLDIVVEDDFNVTITAPADGDIGFPDWLPFSIREAGLQWPVVSEPTSLFTLLEDVATSRVVISGGLQGSETGFPFTGQVDGLVVDLGILGNWLTGDFTESPIVDLDGVLIGVEPRDWGGARIGGGLALGVVDNPTAGAPAIWYGRLFGEFAIDGFGLALDMVMSEQGPLAASFAAPAAIPLDPSGLMLSGVSGGIDFTPDGSVPGLADLDCVVTDGELTCPDGSSPLNVLTDSRYNFDTPGTRFQTLDDIQREVIAQANRQGDGGSFLPEVVTIYIGGDISHAALGGAITGQVRLAATLDGSIESQGLRLLGTGNVSLWGVGGSPVDPDAPADDAGPGGLARVGVLLDLSDPINPDFSVAAQIPSGDSWLSAAIPVQTEFGVRIDTEGLALGLAVALQTFLVESVDNPGLDGVMVDYAALLDANRSLRVAQLLGVEADTKITPALLRTRLQGLLNGSLPAQAFTVLLGETDPTRLAELTADPSASAALAAQAVVSDLLNVASNPGAISLARDFAMSTEDRPPAPSGQAVFQALGQAAQAAATDLLEVANPKLLAEGNAQLSLFGIPFGSPQAARLSLNKEQFFFEATGSVTDTLRRSCLIPACAEALYLLGAGGTDTMSLGFGIPINVESLINGSAFENFDPLRSPWRGTASGEYSMFGFPLAQANGVLLGGSQPGAVDEELATGRFTIEVPESARAAVEAYRPRQPDAVAFDELTNSYSIVVPQGSRDSMGEFGGMLFQAELLLPEFLTDPVQRVTELGDNECFEFPDLVDIPDWFGTCIDETTQPASVGAVQLFAPFPPLFGDCPTPTTCPEWDVDAMYARGLINTSLLSLPLGSAVVEATTSGFNVTARPPFVANSSSTTWTFDVGSRDVLDDKGASYSLPTVGFEGGLTAQDISLLLAEFGLQDVFPTQGFDAEMRARGYSPGFDTTSTDELKRNGGIEITGRASIENLVEEARFSFSLKPRAPRFDGELLPFDLEATAAVTKAEIAGVTVEEGLISVRVINGVVSIVVEFDGGIGDFDVTGELLGTVSKQGVSGTFAGEVVLPESFATGDRVSLAATGTLETNGDFTLGLDVDVDLGPLGIEGTAELAVADKNVELTIDDARVALRSGDEVLIRGTSDEIVVSNSGRLRGDITFNKIGSDDFVSLRGLSARLNADFSAGSGFAPSRPSVGRADLVGINQFNGFIGNQVVFDLAITSGQLQLGFLSDGSPNSAPRLQGPDLTLQIQRDGDFSLTTIINPIDLRLLELERGTAAITYESGVLTARADLAASIPIGDNDPSRVSLSDFSLSSDGKVSGTLAGNLNLLDSQLASVQATLSSPADKPGVIRVGDIDARLGGSGLFADLRFAGFFDTDGTFDLTSTLALDIEVGIGDFDLVALVGTGEVKVNNARATVSVRDAGLTFFGVEFCKDISVELGIYLQPRFGLSGTSSVPCLEWLGMDQGEITWPIDFVPDGDASAPTWISVPSGLELRLPFNSTSAVVDYTLPTARNGEVSCAPAPGDTVRFSTTVECSATSSTNETISTSFPLVVKRQDGLTSGVNLAGINFVGVETNDDTPVTAVVPSTFILLQNNQPVPIATTKTDKGDAIKVQKDDEFAGETKAVPGTTVKGTLRSDPIQVFEVAADAAGTAMWRFAIPEGFPAGDHTLTIVGVGVDGPFTTSIPLLMADSTAGQRPISIVSAVDTATDAVDAESSAGTGTDAQAGGDTTAPAQGSAQGQTTPLAVTGAASRELIMLALMLVVAGTSSLGIRRSFVRRSRRVTD